MDFESGRGKMNQQRHLCTFDGLAPEQRITHMHENWHTRQTCPNLQKKKRVLERYLKPNRKLDIFNFLRRK